MTCLYVAGRAHLGACATGGVVNLSHTGSRVQRTGETGTSSSSLEPCHNCAGPVCVCWSSLVPPPRRTRRGAVSRIWGAGDDPAWTLDPYSSNNPQRDTDNTVGMVRPGLSCKVPVDVVPIGGSWRCLPLSALLVLRRRAGGGCAAPSRRADGGSGRDIHQLID